MCLLLKKTLEAWPAARQSCSTVVYCSGQLRAATFKNCTTTAVTTVVTIVTCSLTIIAILLNNRPFATITGYTGVRVLTLTATTDDLASILDYRGSSGSASLANYHCDYYGVIWVYSDSHQTASLIASLSYFAAQLLMVFRAIPMQNYC